MGIFQKGGKFTDLRNGNEGGFRGQKLVGIGATLAIGQMETALSKGAMVKGVKLYAPPLWIADNTDG